MVFPKPEKTNCYTKSLNDYPIILIIPIILITPIKIIGHAHDPKSRIIREISYFVQ